MARKRSGISKRIRFEVFKRDGFACQYCGAKAPDVLLHVDHVEPASKGGEDEILNYVTACVDCNLGKGARELGDQSTLQKQRAQLSDLNERREQLRLMISWRDGLRSLEEDKLNAVVKRMDAAHTGWRTNETGRSQFAKMLATIPVDLVLEAIDVVSASIELDNDGAATRESVTGIVDRVSRIATIKLRDRRDPGVGALYYIRGMARKRVHNWGPDGDWQAIALLKEARSAGVTEEDMTAVALGSTSWHQFEVGIDRLIASVRRPL